MAILTAATLQCARQDICAADKVMAAQIARLPPVTLSPRRPPFHVLATSIINQQLSQKAAAAIERRVALLTPAPFAGAAVLKLPPAKLRAAGLSGRKIDYLRTMAEVDAAGALALPRLRKMTDAEVIRELTAIRGIGAWTAEMFLMFCLRRPDVLSLGDAGLLRAARRLYGKRLKGDDAQVLEKAAARWKPWRTVGCFYLWRSLDNAPTASN